MIDGRFKRISTYLVEVTVKKLVYEALEAKTSIDPIEEDLNIMAENFTAKTGKNIEAISVKKIGNRYKIVLEIQR